MALNIKGIKNLFKRKLNEGEGEIKTGFGIQAQHLAKSKRSYVQEVLNIPITGDTELGSVTIDIEEGQTVLISPSPSFSFLLNKFLIPLIFNAI